jgi:hypothetical protein
MQIFLAAMNGCSCNAEYIEATVTKMGITFSFEYPSSYIDPSGTLTNEYPSGGVTEYVSDNDRYLIKKIITVSIREASLEYPTSGVLIDHAIEDLEMFWGQFELIERSNVRVAGIDGEMVVYSGYFQNLGYTSNHYQVWEVYLDYMGQIVIIMLYSTVNMADEAEADFEHLIQTFKFLD